MNKVEQLRDVLVARAILKSTLKVLLRRTYHFIKWRGSSLGKETRGRCGTRPNATHQHIQSVRSFFRFMSFEADSAGSRCRWFHELTDGFEERMDMVIVRFNLAYLVYLVYFVLW